MNKFIENIISVSINNIDPVYVHALPHKDLIIGKRGLVGNEINSGIILSIGSKSALDLSFDKVGFYVKLKFAGVWQDVFVPYESICAIIDDLSKPSFIFNFVTNIENRKIEEKKENKNSHSNKVINFDFKNHKKK